MTTQEVANRLVDLCRMGQNDAAVVELYAQDAVSIEAADSPDKITKGIDNIRKKGDVLRQTIKEYHGASISEPLVAGAYFSVQMAMEVTFNNGHRVNMQEVCVYKVKKGKIVEEQFFYDTESE